MARKKDTPQKAALREMMGNYLKDSVNRKLMFYVALANNSSIGSNCVTIESTTLT